MKRPSVTITQTEVAQIKSYAEAVASDPQFNAINVHWDFWVISSELERTVARDANESGRALGQIAEWNDNIRIWAKTWSQVIDECETRLRHFKDALGYDASKEHAADYINRTPELRKDRSGGRPRKHRRQHRALSPTPGCCSPATPIAAGTNGQITAPDHPRLATPTTQPEHQA